MKLSSSFFAKAAVAAATVGTSTIKASPLVTTTEDGSNVADAYFQMRAGSELIDERAQVSGICAAIASSNGSSDVSYDQPYRPQIHFSPSSGFMNDPNGLVITKNEQGKETVHMYYQYNPTQLVAGNQHWGTATSNGFETYAWQNHLPAIAPANSSEGIFSGSAVIDSNNTSGFFNESTYSGERVVAIYTLNTATEQTQNLAYSTDGGFSFQKYENNPVLTYPGKYQTQFRDPKVFWHAETSRWVMAVAHTQEYEIGFYTSPDLRSWTEVSRLSSVGSLGFQYECPDLFQARYVGGPKDGELGWVLLISVNPGAPLGGSITQYFWGDFDGTTFTPSDRALRLADFGKDWYAAQTWNNGETDRQRTMIVGWASNWQYTNVVPTSPWRSVMSLPREVTLQWTSYNPLHEDYMMAMLPVTTESIQDQELFNTSDTSSSGNQTISLDGDGAFEIDVTFVLTADGVANATTTSYGELRIHADRPSGAPSYLKVGLLGGEQGGIYVDRRKAGGDWADDNVFFTDRFSTQVEPRFSSNDTETADQYYDFKLVVDRSITETFVQGGIQSTATLTYWADEAVPNRLEVLLGDDIVKVHSLKVVSLKSTWNKDESEC